MHGILDAPEIREAEMYGMPDPPTVKCPICCRAAENFFIDNNTGDVIGCDECAKTVDAWEWLNEHKEGA